jgi:hypothetical protein
MQILLTLNSGLGADTGPNFNLTANVGSVSPSTATKSELLAGILVTIDDTATQVTVTSVGVCTTSINISVSGITTSTTTLAVTSFTLGYDNSNFFTSCTNYISSPQTFYSTVGSTLIEGTILYDDIGLTSLSSNGYYSDGTNWWRITSGDGVIYSTGACATTTTTSTTTTVAPTTTSTTTTLAPTTTTSTSTTTLANAVFSLGYDASVGWQSCYATQTTYYSYAGDIVQNGTYLFTDITLSTKAPVGYYSNGTNYYYVASICNEYTFTNTLGYDESVEYYDCSGNPQTLLVYDGTTSSAVCVDSITNLNGLTANNNGLGSCTPNSIGILQDETPCPTTSTTSTTSTSTTSTSTSTTSTSTSTTSTSTTTTAAPTTTTTTEAGTTTTTTLAPGETSTTTTSTTAAPTTTTTTTAAGTTTTTTAAASEWYDLLLCSDLTTHKTSEQYTVGTFAINERVETASPIDTYRIVAIYTTDPGGVKNLIVPTGFTGCPTTTTTTTQPPTTTTTTTQPQTTTTTTTAAPGGGFISITNSGTFGSSIDDVTPAWFIITSVSGLPVGSGQVASGDHSGYTGNFGVTVSAATGLELKLVVNSSVVSSQIISADGMYTFVGVSIPSNANVDIQLLVSA